MSKDKNQGPKIIKGGEPPVRMEKPIQPTQPKGPQVNAPKPKK